MLRLMMVCLFLPFAAMADGVVLLHGISRHAASLKQMQDALEGQGYEVLNLDYPSRSKSLEEIAAELQPRIHVFARETPGQVHFVTHSMGGLVARAYLAKYRPENLGRV